jgi:hypothetical protein
MILRMILEKGKMVLEFDDLKKFDLIGVEILKNRLL